MIGKCKAKGLVSVEGDLEELCFKGNSFDGVWAYTSLLHSIKDDTDYNLFQIKRVLRDGGLLYLGMKEGNFEGFLESDKYPGVKRFFSLYADEEFSEIVSRRFKIISKSKTRVKKALFLNYLCRKK